MAISPDPKRWQIGLVGYGEVGRIFAEDLRKQDIKVAAYDIKLGGDQQAASREHADMLGVALAGSHAELAGSADFIVSAVTASNPERRRLRYREAAAYWSPRLRGE